jgi:hypothetical protein
VILVSRWWTVCEEGSGSPIKARRIGFNNTPRILALSGQLSAVSFRLSAVSFSVQHRRGSTSCGKRN